jgi:hypothetical protein
VEDRHIHRRRPQFADLIVRELGAPLPDESSLDLRTEFRRYSGDENEVA